MFLSEFNIQDEMHESVQFLNQMKNKDDHIGLKMKTFNFIRKLGSGAWSTVYEAYDQKTRGPVACKVIPKRLMDETPKLKELVQTQITVLQRCYNDNVIKYIDSFSNDKNVYIFTEFCNGGDMEEYLKKKGTLGEDEAREFLKQILNGFRGLHEVGAMHRDFKAANILLHNGVAKIADLGFAKILKNKVMTGTILGTSVTMAPELLQSKNYGKECDIWSVGVVYYQLLMGDYPYNAMNDPEILKKIKSGPPKFSDKYDISEQSKDFIRKCLTIDPKKRISWKAMYEHPLLSDKNKNMRQTYICTINSKISMNKNKQFYQKQQDINPMNQIQGANFEFQKANLEQSNDLQKIQQQLKKRQAIEGAILDYTQRYLEKRNKIMLVLKYGISPIFELQTLPINQNLYAFLMCKKSFIEIADFRKSVNERANIFKIKTYLAEFGASTQYVRITEQVNSDYELINAYATSFMSEVSTKSPLIKAQLTLTSVTPNFPTIFRQELNAYSYQLYDQRNYAGVRKQAIIKLMTFAADLANGINMTSDQYDRRIETLDMGLMEKEFGKKMQALYNK